MPAALRLVHTELREWSARRGQTDDGLETGPIANEVVYRNPAGLDKPAATFLALDQFLELLESGAEATNSGQDNFLTMASSRLPTPAPGGAARSAPIPDRPI